MIKDQTSQLKLQATNCVLDSMLSSLNIHCIGQVTRKESNVAYNSFQNIFGIPQPEVTERVLTGSSRLNVTSLSAPAKLMNKKQFDHGNSGYLVDWWQHVFQPLLLVRV